jgi:hypothetical protein
LQVPAIVATPPAHDVEPHVVPEAQSRQAPAWQCPSVPQLVDAEIMQIPRGSAEPLLAAAHVPFVPPVRAAEQAWHAPLHAPLQQ